MKQYYRIANDSKNYKAEFDNLEEAKNWLIAHNIPEVMHDLVESNYSNWQIEHCIPMPNNENIQEVDFCIPFKYHFDSLSLEEKFEFGEKQKI